MKRRIRQVIVFLLLGAIVNVAVAWGCVIAAERATAEWKRAPLQVALLRPLEPREITKGWALMNPKERSRLIRLGWEPSGLGPQPNHSWDSRLYEQDFVRGGLVRREFDEGIVVNDLMVSRRVSREIKAGWPAHSLWGVGFNINSGAQQSVWLFHGVLQTPWQTKRWYLPTPRLALPIGVEPIGFALNTLFYTMVLWLLFAAPFAQRRRRRSKRGLCPACAYPIGARDVCTECGSPLPVGEGLGVRAERAADVQQ